MQEYSDGRGTITVGYRLGRDERFEVDGEPLGDVAVLSASQDAVVLVAGGVRRVFEVDRIGDVAYVDTHGFGVVLMEVPRFPDADGDVAAGSLLAPMPGRVVRVEVNPGDAVVAGQVLVVIEAMKMEHRIVAAVDGTVGEVAVEAGQMVDEGQTLVVLDEGDAE